MQYSSENADLTDGAPCLPLRADWPASGARAIEVGLSLLILGYLFRGVLAFAAWTLEFLWK